MGKGSKARPFDIPKDQYDVNWERIFGMAKKHQEKQKPNKDENKKTK